MSEMVTEQFGGLAGGFKSQLCRILAAKLEVIHCISLYLGFLRCNINITLVFSIKVSASSGGHRRGCQDRKGMRHESDVLGKTPVREVGEAWGAGRAFRPQCRCVPWAGEREGLFWQGHWGVTEPKSLPEESHLRQGWTRPGDEFLPHSSPEGEPPQSTVVNYSRTVRGLRAPSHATTAVIRI